MAFAIGMTSNLFFRSRKRMAYCYTAHLLSAVSATPQAACQDAAPIRAGGVTFEQMNTC